MQNEHNSGAVRASARVLAFALSLTLLAEWQIDAQAQTLSAQIDGKTFAADQCLKPWHDGTQICLSGINSGFRLMTFNHPEHKRWVVQYENEALKDNDGGAVRSAPAYTAIFLDGPQQVAQYGITKHAMGQEWSHEEGRRAYIRAPKDLEARGDIPKHSIPVQYDLIWPAKVPSVKPVPQHTIAAAFIEPYRPLMHGPLVPWMPAQGGHAEVHWTTALSRWLIYDNQTGRAEAEAHYIKVAAESFASFPLFLTDKAGLHAPDLMTPYYRNAAFHRADFARDGNHVIFANGAPFQIDVPRWRGFMLDDAHLACPSWEQFLLDGDPYHLRNLQFCANYGIGVTDVKYRANGSQDGQPALVPSRVQRRGYGKTLMLLWRAYEYTPDGDWEWLLPKSYFKRALDDSEYQAKTYLSRFPDARFGRLQVDYLDGKKPAMASGVGHTEVQALWSIGWVLAKGWSDFQPLFDQLTTGFVDVFNTFGASTTHVQNKLRQAKGPLGAKRLFQTYEEAGKWFAQEYPDITFGPNISADRHVWQEQRFEGVFKSLVQLGFEDYRPLALMMDASRLKISKCFAQKNSPSVPIDADCPGMTKGFAGLSEDWSFALDGSPGTPDIQAMLKEARAAAANEQRAIAEAAETKAAEKLEAKKKAAATSDAKQSQAEIAPEPTVERPRVTQAEAATPTNSLPLAGAGTLPDPGTVTLPDPGSINLP